MLSFLWQIFAEGIANAGKELSTNECLFVPSLSFRHEKAMVALYFGRIFTRLGVADFQVFRLLLLLFLS